MNDDPVRSSYDAIAEQYTAELYDELAHKPLDRALLQAFVEQAGDGVVADVGCGPGHVTRYLHGLGATAVGIDLSPAMVAVARRRTPEIPFRVGSMLALDVPDGAWAGIVALYSIIHLPPDGPATAMQEFCRVLRPGGLLLVGVHVGTDRLSRDEMWGVPVRLDFQLFQRRELVLLVREAGLTVAAVVERLPYDGHEYPTTRCYVLARKPA